MVTETKERRMAEADGTERAVGTRGLSVDRATVRYPGTDASARPAVDRASLAVEEREIVALLGPSGCGKSTLLRAVAGLEPLAGGRIAWAGEDLAGVAPHRRGFGLMFQDGQLFGHRNVGANVSYGMESQRMPKPERAARVAELLELVGLPGSEGRRVTELSGGERQRIALARSLAPRPRLLLLDEPLSALDRELRTRLAEDLARLLRETGTTAILVTHDPEEAEAIADRVVRMRDGRVLAEESAA
ncbi:ABC transporter [Leucobacter sp. OLJS4]|nr:ABC transporter [Leucobacter sp. OLCALW19]PII86942.1 ABC transporter [Leucobacter sp. OLTLW20]PII89218.1 ABC transporter [Leucobacter sp. OLAS13]PII99428.1 ABC transporter [Leucobacter sp. OLDS2]PII99932.1 ABC transporter [Leucobacter sp. OLCS4]PIJ01564.1 ABC transporter [Leucobacter sp. OLIS6]PIJ13419.1 ABC transporter [Leucobacter sp. OLJS4]PIJ57402.1 ABC transporter [Leucobacter sp. OAMSW11]